MPGTPSVAGIVTHEAFLAAEAAWSAAPSETTTRRLIIALAVSASVRASAVVNSGSASTSSTSAVVDLNSRAARSTSSRRAAITTVWPITAGTTTNDLLSFARVTRAGAPTFPASSTSASATCCRAVGSACSTAETSRGLRGALT